MAYYSIAGTITPFRSTLTLVCAMRITCRTSSSLDEWQEWLYFTGNYWTDFSFGHFTK